MVTLRAPVERRARKAHVCAWCCGPIDAGTVYSDAAYVDEDNGCYSWRAHLTCDTLADAVPPDWYEDGALRPYDWLVWVLELSEEELYTLGGDEAVALARSLRPSHMHHADSEDDGEADGGKYTCRSCSGAVSYEGAQCDECRFERAEEWNP